MAEGPATGVHFKPFISLLAGLDSNEGHALQTGLPGAGQGDRASRVPSLLTAPEAACTLQVSLSVSYGHLMPSKPLTYQHGGPHRVAGQRQPLGTIPEGLGASSGLLLALGPWGKAGPVEGVEGGGGLAWAWGDSGAGPALPHPLPLSRRSERGLVVPNSYLGKKKNQV